jgi:hypothetical protein
MRVRNRSRGAGLLLLAALAPACATSTALTRSLPRAVPGAETLAGWESAAGEAEDGERVVVYELYVNPLRPGLYEITRFRLDRLEGAAPERRRRLGRTETLLWNERPGTREPLVCYERASRRGWRTLWLRRSTWRRLVPGTPEYQAAMFTALRVYGLHRARLGLPPI